MDETRRELRRSCQLSLQVGASLLQKTLRAAQRGSAFLSDSQHFLDRGHALE
jgi:hypothetical protein